MTNIADVSDPIASPLRNGWEPDTPPGDTIARQALDALIERARSAATAVGAPWDDDGYVAMADLSLPGLFGNHAMVRRPGAVERSVDRCESFFPPSRPYLLWSPFPTGDLHHRGLEAVGHPPLMARPAASGRAAGPPELEITAVTSDVELAEFERTLIAAYPLDEWVPLAAGTAFPASVLRSGALRYWLGRVDGVPVATASTVSVEGLNFVEWVSCRAADRGHGYGAAMTEAAATAEPGQPAALLASDDGRSVYARLGFLAVCRWTLWWRPPR